MFATLKRNKNTKPIPIKEFDKEAWHSFVKFIHKEKFKNTDKNWTNILFVSYNYLGVEYDRILYKHVLKDEKFIGIEFWVPEHPESTLSCRLINRVANVADAIGFISELTQNSFAN